MKPVETTVGNHLHVLALGRLLHVNRASLGIGGGQFVATRLARAQHRTCDTGRAAVSVGVAAWYRAGCGASGWPGNWVLGRFGTECADSGSCADLYVRGTSDLGVRLRSTCPIAIGDWTLTAPISSGPRRCSLSPTSVSGSCAPFEELFDLRVILGRTRIGGCAHQGSPDLCRSDFCEGLILGLVVLVPDFLVTFSEDFHFGLRRRRRCGRITNGCCAAGSYRQRHNGEPNTRVRVPLSMQRT